MTWGTDNTLAQRERSRSLSAAYHGPAGLPAPRRGEIPGHWKSAPTGSRGGAPIWVMEEAYVPGGQRGKALEVYRAFRGEGRGAADADGFAVFGRYPKGFLRHVVKIGLLGDVTRSDSLHVCSGTLSASERWTTDLRIEARPRVVADGRFLPYKTGCFKAVMLDPPYSDQYARNLYGTENPRPSWLLREAARVVIPGGRVGMLHVAVPFAPPQCRLVKVYGVSTGVGLRIRAFTVYERDQDSLWTSPPASPGAWEGD